MRVAEGASQYAMREVHVLRAELDPSGVRVTRLAVGDDSDDRFAGGPVDDASRSSIARATEARALRIRARVLRWLAVRAVVDPAGLAWWTGLGSGPAFPLASAIAEASGCGADIAATFIDTGEEALETSRRVALAHGVDPSAHVYLSGHEALAWARQAAGTQDLVEALALLERRTVEEAAIALSDAFALVRPGGTLVFSTTLADRPVGDGAMRASSSPQLTLARIADLIDAAGIPVMDAMVHIPQDGVNAVVEVSRL